jgi:hypothetical protein
MFRAVVIMFRAGVIMFRAVVIKFRSGVILFRAKAIMFRAGVIMFRAKAIMFRDTEIMLGNMVGYGGICLVPMDAPVGTLCGVISKGGAKYYVWRKTAETRRTFDHERRAMQIAAKSGCFGRAGLTYVFSEISQGPQRMSFSTKKPSSLHYESHLQ